MSLLRFDRVPSRSLSLWQSAVAENARRQLERKANRPASQTEVMQHPMVVAAAEHVTSTFEGNPPDNTRNLAVPHQLNVYLSHLCYAKVNAEREGDLALADALRATYRQFSDKDPGFLCCAATYAAYWCKYNGNFVYNDWTGHGMQYGVIDYRLPNNAKVAIIGDWGTGLDDAIAMVIDIVKHHQPTAIIHLGDIYYSGMPEECTDYFINALSTAGAGDIPVFTLPGNHDYYALGYGFYPMLRQLNKNVIGAQQEASYFCLRTEDMGYQFLGMDTGYNDANPGDQADPNYAGPWLQPNEILWHQDKLNNFSGATILLSHHQLFTTNAKLNGDVSAYADLPYLNPYLYQVFWPYLQTKVAAWLWGHEHNFAAYQPGLLQLQQGVLLGCSAYEELASANPYYQNYPQIPYYDNSKNWQLHTNTDPNGIAYYNHAFAIVDFSVRKTPADPVQIQYFEFPSWGPLAPINPASKPLLSMNVSRPKPKPVVPVQFLDIVNLFSQEGLFISPIYEAIGYSYPTATTNTPVRLRINGSTGPLTHDSRINIETTEPAVGVYNLLGAWSTATLYYYIEGYPEEEWNVMKADTSSGSQINYGDIVYFVNPKNKQYLSIYWSRAYGNIYLTTQSNIYYWQILKPMGSDD